VRVQREEISVCVCVRFMLRGQPNVMYLSVTKESVM
jgi:hypothetical protein